MPKAYHPVLGDMLLLCNVQVINCCLFIEQSPKGSQRVLKNQVTRRIDICYAYVQFCLYPSANPDARLSLFFVSLVVVAAGHVATCDTNVSFEV